MDVFESIRLTLINDASINAEFYPRISESNLPGSIKRSDKWLRYYMSSDTPVFYAGSRTPTYHNYVIGIDLLNENRNTLDDLSTMIAKRLVAQDPSYGILSISLSDYENTNNYEEPGIKVNTLFFNVRHPGE